MKKLIYIFILTLLLDNSAKGQDYPIYNQYLFGSYFLINPAVAGIDNMWKIQAIHRQQWMGIENAPRTQSMALEGEIHNNLKGGVYVFADRNGYYHQNGHNIALSYVVPIGDEKTSLRRLSFGLSYSGIKKYVNVVDIVKTNDPALINGLYEYYNHSSNFGTFLIWDGLYAGIAGSSILSTNTVGAVSDALFPRNYNGIVGIKLKAAKELYVEPSAMLRVIENYDNFLDLNTKMYYTPVEDKGENNYWVGLSYRTSWKDLPIKSVSLSAFLGGSYNNFYYGYSYELMLNSFQGSHGGSSQFMIGHNLSLKYDRKCGCTPFSIPTL